MKGKKTAKVLIKFVFAGVGMLGLSFLDAQAIALIPRIIGFGATAVALTILIILKIRQKK